MQAPSLSVDGPCALCGPDSSHQDHIDAPRLSRRAALTAAGAASAFIGGVRTAHASAHQTEAVPTGEYVVEAGWLLIERDGRHELLRDASVLVSGDRVEKITEGRITGNYARIDAHKHLVTPGFISGHTHACTATPTRGLIENGRRPNNRRPQEFMTTISFN